MSKPEKLHKKIQPIISEEKSLLIISDDSSKLEYYGKQFAGAFEVDVVRRHKLNEIERAAKDNNVIFICTRSKHSRFECAELASRAHPFCTCVFLEGTDIEESDDIWMKLEECHIVTDCTLNWQSNKFLIGGDRVQASIVSVIYKMILQQVCSTKITRRLSAELARAICKSQLKFEDVHPSLRMEVQNCIDFIK